jgi:putative DNA primase/helicase
MLVPASLTTRCALIALISCVGPALDPGCERPEERTFLVDLHKVVPERRADLAVASLTITRAYLTAGEPDVGIPNFARFEDWSRFVRQPLVWLGMEDPIKGRERIEAHNSVRAQLWPLLQAWRDNYPGEEATVGEALRLATREAARDEPEADIETRQRLRDALFAIGGEMKPSAITIGRFLGKHENRIEGGLRFVSRPGHGGVPCWRVKREGEG